MSKGSWKRPQFVSNKEMSDNWGAIVWKKTPEHGKTQKHEDKRKKAQDKYLDEQAKERD